MHHPPDVQHCHPAGHRDVQLQHRQVDGAEDVGAKQPLRTHHNDPEHVPNVPLVEWRAGSGPQLVVTPSLRDEEEEEQTDAADDEVRVERGLQPALLAGLGQVAHHRVCRQRGEATDGDDGVGEHGEAAGARPHRGAAQLHPRQEPEHGMEGNEEAHSGVPHLRRASAQWLPTIGRRGGVADDSNDPGREEGGVEEPDSVRGAEDAPQGVDLTVRLRLGRLERGLPIHLQKCGEPLPLRQLEEPAAVEEVKALDEARRIAEELVPIVVVGHVRRQEGRIRGFELLPVLLVLHALDRIVPLVEDDIVDRANDLGQKQAAVAVRPAWCPLAQRRHVKGLGAQRELGDEVNELGHEANVPRLTPDQQVHRDLRHGRCQLRARRGVHGGAGQGGEGPTGAAEAPRHGAIAEVGGGVALEAFAPMEEALEEIGVDVADGLL
mmetsp:Transcript_116966/g.338093  ORF Transcript_116966/g.338093 Transcript_116966/m.338093 type:complete len:436 (+) Transcript_116966:837-2144(+)